MTRLQLAALPFSFVALSVAGCAGSAASSPPPPPPVSSPALPPAASASAAAPPDVPAAAAAPTSGIPAALNEAADRVRAAMASPDDAHLTATFSPAFLTHVPPAKLRELFSSVHAQAGDCSRQELVEKKSDQQAVLRIVCANGSFLGSFHLNDQPPHLIDGLLLKPEPR